MTTWRPIATAPRDGTEILAYLPEAYETIDIVSYELDGVWCHARCVEVETVTGLPTHWMPLPEVPVVQV